MLNIADSVDACSVARAAKVPHKRTHMRSVARVIFERDACWLGLTGSLAAAIAAALSLSPAAAGPALLFDAADGRVLYAEDADNQWHPASLTKIMTAYVTFEAIKEGKLTLETKIACSELASSQAPSKIGLPVGADDDGRDGAAGPDHQVGQRRGGDAGRGGGRARTRPSWSA